MVHAERQDHPQRMTRLIGFAALIGFCISLVVHLCALSGIDVQTAFPNIWMLHVGIFFVDIPFALSIQKMFGERPTAQALRAAIPTWVFVAAGCLFAYTIIDVALSLIASEGGEVVLENGRRLLLEKGTLVRELTLEQYAARRANEIRGVSANWLLFYFVPCAYFLFRKEPVERGSA